MPRRRSAIAVLLLCALVGCEESSPSQAATPATQPGRRTSTYGKAMDRAEDLQKEVADYNRKVEQAIEQGTAPDPKKPRQP